MGTYETEDFCVSDKEIKNLIKLKEYVLHLCKTTPNDQKLGETIRQYCLKEFKYLDK